MQNAVGTLRIVIVASVMVCTTAAATALAGGPDVFVCFIGGTSNDNGFENLGQANGIKVFSVLTVTCNGGDVPATWDDDPPEPDHIHPVIAQNMFRLRGGRFEQIGQSWLKHTYGAAQGDGWCTSCQPGGDAQHLGVGCCDAYGGVVNGSQWAGPRSEMNAATAEFPFPFCSPADGGMDCPEAEPVIGRRLQVKMTDLDTNPGVMYFIEVHQPHPEDATLSIPPTDDNNASYRRISINAQQNLALWTGPTGVMQPAILAWKANGLGMDIPDPSMVETAVDVPDDGRFWVVAQATPLGQGMWHYEYAVHNLNSDRSAQSFTVPLAASCAGGTPIVVTNVGFHDVDYHSGEPYALTDWTVTSSATSVTWSSESYEANVNANALRWGTLYNFRFDANAPPRGGQITLGLFKPGEPAHMIASTIVPAMCPADIAPPGGNCQVNVSDLLAVIGAWGPCPASPESCPADVVASGTVNVADLLAVIGDWGACP